MCWIFKCFVEIKRERWCNTYWECRVLRSLLSWNKFDFLIIMSLRARTLPALFNSCHAVVTKYLLAGWLTEWTNEWTMWVIKGGKRTQINLSSVVPKNDIVTQRRVPRATFARHAHCPHSEQALVCRDGSLMGPGILHLGEDYSPLWNEGEQAFLRGFSTGSENGAKIGRASCRERV